ncbi:M20/M25/M40 family metallo-hydrolase [Anatilimnocola sp. NA78]|uniref:M20/M25/M40 family metallo-hydrolase n=1 Tax=Anatilimnocola sp. NA78 TaxID=3415683 RepID=UPI003CE4CAC8
MTTRKTPGNWYRFAARAFFAAAAATSSVGLLSPLAAQGEESRAKAAALMAADSITNEELKELVDVLADDTFEGREAGSRGGQAAGNYLVQRFTELKLQPAGDKGTFYQGFRASNRNILGMMEGSDEKLKHEVIIIGAHYDHVGYGRPGNSYGPFGLIHNGADDNASGVAGLLEVAEGLNQLPERPKRSILFALWDAEEAGLIGSRYWLSTPTLDLARIKLKINTDMIGRLRNDKLEIYGSRTAPGLRRLVSEQNQHVGLNIDFTWKMKEDSDHWPFYARSIPTLMFHTGLHDNYHRPSDDTHLLNVEGIREVSRLMTLTLIELANAETAAPFREMSKRESPDVQIQKEQPVRHGPPRFGVSWRIAKDAPAAITAITPASPAEQAGLKVGDQLLSFNGLPINDEPTMRLQLLAAAGECTFEVQRAGEETPRSIKVTPAGQPIRVGITWREDDGEPGVMLLTQVVPGSAAEVAGMKLRDRIYALNGQSFATGNDFSTLLATAESPFNLLVERGGKLQTVKVEPLPAARTQQAQ